MNRDLTPSSNLPIVSWPLDDLCDVRGPVVELLRLGQVFGPRDRQEKTAASGRCLAVGTRCRRTSGAGWGIVWVGRHELPSSRDTCSQAGDKWPPLARPWAQPELSAACPDLGSCTDCWPGRRGVDGGWGWGGGRGREEGEGGGRGGPALAVRPWTKKEWLCCRRHRCVSLVGLVEKRL